MSRTHAIASYPSDAIALLNALAERLIPGIPRNVRITVVSQLDVRQDEQQRPDKLQGQDEKDQTNNKSALQFVLDGHVERTRLMREKARELRRPRVHV